MFCSHKMSQNWSYWFLKGDIYRLLPINYVTHSLLELWTNLGVNLSFTIKDKKRRKEREPWNVINLFQSGDSGLSNSLASPSWAIDEINIRGVGCGSSLDTTFSNAKIPPWMFEERQPWIFAENKGTYHNSQFLPEAELVEWRFNWKVFQSKYLAIYVNLLWVRDPKKREQIIDYILTVSPCYNEFVAEDTHQ